MTVQNLPAPETLETEIPMQAQRHIGQAALNESQPEAEVFIPKTTEQLLQEIMTADPATKLESLTYDQQPAFSHSVHGVLNKYFYLQHKSEWTHDVAHAIAPPLPYQWVSSRLDTYYQMMHKGDGDTVHENTIKTFQKQHLPYAIELADALPEIATAIDIQALLDDAGYEVAADAVSDLLSVYGVTIYYLKEKQAKIKRQQQEIAQRALQNEVETELLQ